MGASIGMADEHFQEPSAGSHDHEHAHGDPHSDPHWWLAPRTASRALQPLANALAALDPAGAPGYLQRANELERRLRDLDRELLDLLLPVQGAGIVAAHPAWIHFAEAYRLRLVGAVEPVPGREPSPREIRDLIATARRERLATIFTEPQFSDSAAQVIARDAGLRVETVDPIGGAGSLHRASYFDLMRFNAAAFRRGLTPPTANGRAG